MGPVRGRTVADFDIANFILEHYSLTTKITHAHTKTPHPLADKNVLQSPWTSDRTPTTRPALVGFQSPGTSVCTPTTRPTLVGFYTNIPKY